MSHRPIFKSHDLAQRIFDQRRISRNGISIRAVLMSLSLTALLALTAPYVQLVLRGSSLTASRMPVGALAIYFLLIAILNPLIARIASRYAFTRKELALIYLCMLVSVTLATNGCALYLFSVITAPIYYASPANNWAELFWSYIPSWLTVWDQETIRDFYHGIPMGEHLPWRAWQIPLIAWFAFTVAWLIAYVCLGALLSYRWIREEKLLFPLACVPVDMLGEQQHPRLSSHFFRNGIMWLGFAIPFIIHSINAMSYHIPSFPRWQLSGHNIGRAFTNPPWNAAAELQIGIHFAVIGIGFIISADVGLSFWSFYLLSVLQRVALHALGIGARAIGSVTAATCILRGEEIGAFTLLSGTYLWALRGISRYRLSRDGYSLDITSARCMLIGLSIAVCVIIGWLHAAGAPLWFAIAWLLNWYAVAIGLARVVSAGGLLYIECSYVAWDPIAYVLGTRNLPRSGLIATAFPQMIFTFDQGAITLPFITDAMKFIDAERLNARSAIPVMLSSMLTALVIGCSQVFRLAYRCGAASLNPWFMNTGPRWSFQRISNWVMRPSGTDWMSSIGIIIGALATIGIMNMQRNFLWFPFNPIGLLMASTWTMRHLWFSLFCGWLLKVAILRWGGHKAYELVRPGFIGLIIGEFIVGALWAVIDAITGTRGHQIVFG